MKKKSTTQSARALIALLVCGAACLIVTGIPLRAGLVSSAPNRRRGICEDSDLRRARILPTSDRRSLLASRDLAGGAPRPQAFARCSDVSGATRSEGGRFWRNSRALEDYWQRLITADQYRLKWNAWRSTPNNPRYYENSCAALGKDPFVIAECSVRRFNRAFDRQLVATRRTSFESPKTDGLRTIS